MSLWGFRNGGPVIREITISHNSQQEIGLAGVCGSMDRVLILLLQFCVTSGLREFPAFEVLLHQAFIPTMVIGFLREGAAGGWVPRKPWGSLGSLGEY